MRLLPLLPLATALCLLPARGGSNEPLAPDPSGTAGAGPTVATALAVASAQRTPGTVVAGGTAERAVAATDATGAAVPDPWIAGFDASEYLVPVGNGQSEELLGLPDPEAQPAGDVAGYPGRLLVQYEGGVDAERRAVITPVGNGNPNRVLRFTLTAPNVRDAAGQATKGRVQLNAYSADALRAREVRFSARMYLHGGFGALKTLPQAFNWLTVSEWWNDAAWTGQAYPFRITLNLAKPGAARGSPLRFAVSAETLDPQTRVWNKPLWKAVNTRAEVPIGRWVTLEYHFREGNASEGRFYLAMVPDGGPRQVLFDIRNWTHHPSNPAPDGLTHLNPVKLYTAKTLIDAARPSGGLVVDWDDLSFRLCRQRFPVDTSPCRPDTFR